MAYFSVALRCSICTTVHRWKSTPVISLGKQSAILRKGGLTISSLRTRRLALVYVALQQTGPADSVTDILLRHGVASFGHFAMRYRKQYRCLPSETLRRQA
ncbi:hypothetical protein ACYZT7_12110 [Pseudomonas sp. RT4P38]